MESDAVERARVPSCSSSSRQLSTSHSRHDVSKEVVPTYRPDGWKATRERRPAWPLSSPTGSVASRDQSLATPSQPPETRLAALGLRPLVASGCHAKPATRSVCPRSVETCLQSGTLQILTMCDHEPVAQRPEPGEKATAEMGRSSPKLESWFCTPRSSPSRPIWVDSCEVTSLHCASICLRSASSRSIALPMLYRHSHSRASLSATVPSE